MRGGQRQITVTRQEHCRTCKGVGRLHVAESRCVHCHGSGSVKSARGHMVFSKPCAQCGGTGGSGRPRVRPAPVTGRDANRTAVGRRACRGWPTARGFACPGKGTSAATAARRAICTSASAVQPHALFRRDGDDLHLTVPVAVHEAALGAKIDVPALDGPARGCACRRARNRGSASGCATAASHRRATAGAAIWSSRCGWCCRGCSTSARKSCCGNSGGSTARTCGRLMGAPQDLRTSRVSAVSPW